MAAPNYYMNIYVSVIGLSGAGGFFAKEFARYAASLKDDETFFKLLLFDPEDVGQEDITKSVFLPQDVGWNRAAVLSGALRKAYPSITCIKGIARNFPNSRQVVLRDYFLIITMNWRMTFTFCLILHVLQNRNGQLKSFGKDVSPVLQPYIGEIRFLWHQKYPAW